MASVNFYKCKGAGSAKAMMRHSEKEERLKHNHSNLDLDKSCTEKNSSLYGLSYEDMCQKYDERISMLDTTTNNNKRSDRVTMFSLEYSVPEDLPEWLEDSYLEDVEKIIAEQYGEHNIIESERHFDEKHMYMDHGEEKMSRAHAHTFIVPEIDGQLNGKKFSSKGNMQKLNKAIDKMSMERYSLHFMTGKEARKRSVEELKHDSRIEEQQRTIKHNHEAIDQQVAQFNELKAEKSDLTEELANLKDTFLQEKNDLELQYQAEQAKLEEAYAKHKKELTERELKISKKEKALSGRELSLTELKDLKNKTFWSNEDKENILKTAKLSARNADKAEEAISSRDKALKQVTALKKQNEALKKEVPSFSQKLHYENLEQTIDTQKQTIEELKKDISVRDTFIKENGLKEQFINYCSDIGHKLKVAIEQISHGLHM